MTKSVGDVKLTKAQIRHQIDTVFGHAYKSKEDYIAHITTLFSSENITKSGKWSHLQNIYNYDDLLNRRDEDKKSKINPYW